MGDSRVDEDRIHEIGIILPQLRRLREEMAQALELLAGVRSGTGIDARIGALERERDQLILRRRLNALCRNVQPTGRQAI